MEYTHTPVMLKECVEALRPQPGKILVDGTAGLGGHAEALLSKGARVICIDKDPEAQTVQRERLARFGENACYVRDDFRNLSRILASLNLEKVDGVLLDLGVSSLQLDKQERGFSYHGDAPLDMRMNPDGPLSAMEVVNEWQIERLKQIFFEYGEERYSAQIAAAIGAKRPMHTTAELSETILDALPAKARRDTRHPARRVFQAIRIAVNDELGAAEEGILSALSHLSPGGRLAVITFHSLEDRLVKRLYTRVSAGCDCPPDFPACVCGKVPEFKPLKRMAPSKEEVSLNPRASSARLRVIERMEAVAD